MRSHPLLRCAVALVVATTSLAGGRAPAHGDAAPPRPSDTARAEAKRHFDQAIALYNDGDYNAALAEFEAAYQSYPTPGVLYNIGVTQKALFRYPEAIATLERYLGEAKNAPRERIAEVRTVIAEMRALLSELTLDVTPAGATVVVDGRTIGTAPLGPVSLAAGRHVLEVTAPDHEPVRRELTIAAGTPLALKVELKAVLKIGQARISAVPPSGIIQVDGKLAGTGSVELELLAGGHTLTVTAPGYQTYRGELAISAGQRRTVTITLDRIVQKTPLYKKWWLWTITGAVAGGVAAAIAVPLSARIESPLIGTLSPGAGRVN